MQHKQHNRIFTYVAAAGTVAIAAALIAVGAPLALAADQTVNVVPGEDLYSDQNVNLTSGDTITWQNEGTHDVQSARIPAGATAFTSPIQVGDVRFSQTPTVTGNYRYFCTIHSDAAAANAATQSATQMVGQFTVAAGGGAPGPAPAPAPAPAPPPAGGADPPAADPPAADPPAADPPAADPPAADPPAGNPPAADPPQAEPPVGAPETGGGSTAGPSIIGMLMLGGGLLLAAAISVLFGFGRIARRN